LVSGMLGKKFEKKTSNRISTVKKTRNHRERDRTTGRGIWRGKEQMQGMAHAKAEWGSCLPVVAESRGEYAKPKRKK